MGYTHVEQWHRHYADGRGFRRLGEREAALLAEHSAAPPEGGRALDVGCGTGELAALRIADHGTWLPLRP